MRCNSSAGSCAALIAAPPPAAMVWTQRKLGLAVAVRRSASGDTSGMPYSASAESNSRSNWRCCSGVRRNSGSPLKSAGKRCGGSSSGRYSSSMRGSAVVIRSASSSGSGVATATRSRAGCEVTGAAARWSMASSSHRDRRCSFRRALPASTQRPRRNGLGATTSAQRPPALPAGAPVEIRWLDALPSPVRCLSLLFRNSRDCGRW